MEHTAPAPDRETQPTRAPRALLGVVGGAVVLGMVAFVVGTGAELTPTHLVALGAGVTSLAVAGGGARVPPKVGLTLGLLAALAGQLALTWSYSVASFPYVDTVRPWGMDWGPYPVLRPPVAVLVLLAVLPLALGGALAAVAPLAPVTKGVRRRAPTLRGTFRTVGVLACAVLLTFWGVPRWHEMDLIAPEGVVPDLPTHLPLPGRVGKGDSPAVIGGRLVGLHWSEYSFNAAPVRVIPYLVHKELALASLAHGMHWSLADMKVASGALSADAARGQATIRAASWEVQRGVSTGWLYVHVAALPVWGLLALRFVWGRPLGRRSMRGATWLLRALLYAPAA
ncbi:MAG: hypothetical protein Q7U06_01705, partial [Pseudomonadota bacterium]|nr:hypothetical protein [Pseudomonadota bacterium]